MRQLEQMKKEKDAATEKFEKLREDLENIKIKMREEYIRYHEQMQADDRVLLEKDEEIAKKDEMIKNLTQKQLEMTDQINKFQKYLES